MIPSHTRKPLSPEGEGEDMEEEEEEEDQQKFKNFSILRPKEAALCLFRQ